MIRIPKSEKEIESIIGVGKMKKLGTRVKEMITWFASTLPFEKKKKTKSPKLKKQEVVVEDEDDDFVDDEQHGFDTGLQDHGSDEYAHFDDNDDFE